MISRIVFILDNIKPNIKKRTSFIFICILLCNLFCFVNIVRVSLDKSWNLKSYESELYSEPPIALRSNIVDRNGLLIATNVDVYYPYIDLRKISNISPSIEKINSIFSISLSKNIADYNEDKVIKIDKRLTYSEYIKLKSLKIRGLFFAKKKQRFYPNSNLFSHSVGCVNPDGEGLYGIEKFLNRSIISNNANSALRLSLDVRLQNIIRQELLDQMKKFKSRSASGIMIDVNSGEVLSIVSLPDFDPNAYSQATGEEVFNNFASGLYEMGSMMNILIAAAAIDSDSISTVEKVSVEHFIKIGKYYFRDYTQYNNKLSLEEILSNSSNIGISQIALKIPRDYFQNLIKRLELQEISQLEVGEKSAPITPNEFNDIDIVKMGYGYGLSTNLIKFAEIFSSIVNGGVFYNATLLKQDSQPLGNRIIKKNTSLAMRKLLFNLVYNCADNKEGVKMLCIGGKTGNGDKTKYFNCKKGSARDLPFVSFVASFPISNPKYAIIILFDDPKKVEPNDKLTGGYIAAPVASRIISKISDIYNIDSGYSSCNF